MSAALVARVKVSRSVAFRMSASKSTHHATHLSVMKSAR
jgi:hypothetical protein